MFKQLNYNQIIGQSKHIQGYMYLFIQIVAVEI